MPNYDFQKEFAAISRGEPLSLSFFDKVEKMAGDLARKSPPVIWDHALRYWNRQSIQEMAHDFMANYLFEKGNERIRYILPQSQKNQNLDGLLVTMFRQYLSSLWTKKYPYEANIKRRTNGVLDCLLSHEFIEKKELPKLPERYRRAGSMADELNGKEALRQKSGNLPTWTPVMYAPGSKKISPVISTADLTQLVVGVFKCHDGWIQKTTLLSFLFDYLDLSHFTPRFWQPSGNEENAFDVWISELHTEGVPGGQTLKLIIEEVIERLTPRQHDIFRLYFMENYSVPELSAFLSLKKSSIYFELKNIKSVFEAELEAGK